MGQIERLLERPKLYNNVDGVGELGMGAMLLGFGLLTWLQVRSPASALWHKAYVVVPLILLGALGIDRGMKAVKKRVTYPRTGFVEYRKRDTRRLAAISFVVAAVVAVAIAYAVRTHWGAGLHWGLTTPTVVLGGDVLAVAYAYGIARAVRWKWMVVAAIAICSVGLAALPADWADALVGTPANAGPFSTQNVAAWNASMLVYGVIFLISGGISFVLYLRHTQPPAAEGQPPAEGCE